MSRKQKPPKIKGGSSNPGACHIKSNKNPEQKYREIIY